MYIDPIADLIIKIKNAHRAKLQEISIVTSNITNAILNVLKKEGYIDSYNIVNAGKKNKKRVTIVTLKYKNSMPCINGIKQISKPGLRIYQESKKLPKVLNGLGIAIVSTNMGIITDKEARANNVGGEVIAYVW